MAPPPAASAVAPAATVRPLQFLFAPDTVRPEQGYAWIVPLPPEWTPFSSDVRNVDRSRLKLTEDDKPLGPGNATHAEIRKEGRGAYSHWHTALYFSTSDNSDPRTNGRVYAVEIPASDD